MNDVNIDDFYHDMGVILLTLFQQFPRKVSLFIDDISGPDDMDEFGLHSPRYLSAIGALMWLHDEGYVRYSDIIKQESAEDCTLTQKAFVKLIRPNLTADEFAINKSNGPFCVSFLIILKISCAINVLRRQATSFKARFC